MKEEILRNLENPRQLEQLYRGDQAAFQRAFTGLYPTIQNHLTAQVWQERLSFESPEISWGSRQELTFVVLASLLAGLIAKLPALAGLSPDFFYPRNLGFVVFPVLTAYFAWKHQTRWPRRLVYLLVFTLAAVYINALPNNPASDTLVLACIHLPVVLWTVLGVTYLGDRLRDYPARLAFLRYNGDLIVMTAVILLAGGLLTAITLGLFSLIGLRIEEFYFQYVAIGGLAAAPVVGTYLVQTNPHLVSKVSPVIAKVFTPLVLLMLLVYLGAVLVTGQDPYNDREFLLLFNLLLLGVMALILFSVAEAQGGGGRLATLLLLALAAVTIVLNGIALSAIVFRLSEGGMTPNRLAVLGGNLLILANLLLVTYHLVRGAKSASELPRVEASMAAFLPLYGLWALLVTFAFPPLFNFQ
ncbi:hypothetical protein ACW9KT_20040 [Hymenobacter sp. HD11105]